MEAILGLFLWIIISFFKIGEYIGGIQKEPIVIIALFTGAVIIGSGIGALFRFREDRKKVSEITKVNKNYNLFGYDLIPDAEIWKKLIRSVLEYASGNFGPGYTITLRVYLKNPIYPSSTKIIRNNYYFVEGLLQSYEPGRPYDLILYPKYEHKISNVYELKKLLDLSNLNDRSTDSKLLSMIEENLNEDIKGKYYKALVNKFYKNELDRSEDLQNNPTRNEILNRIKNEFQSADSPEVFFDILEKIQFSRYVNNFEVDQKYFDTKYSMTYIPGENIVAIDLLKYETYTEIKMYIDGRTFRSPMYIEIQPHSAESENI